MPDTIQHEQQFPLRLTLAQRKVVAEVASLPVDRLRLDEANQRVISFTLDEMRAIHQMAQRAIQTTDSGMKRNSLRHVADTAEQAIEHFQGMGRIVHKERLYQFKISLKDTAPPIWRRIQVRDCTLDKLHERIQSAMGWTNSHLHHFRITGKLYGDPWLLEESFDECDYEDSTITRISTIMPRSGKRFCFEYEYDFGDSWWHEVLFEGCLRAEPGQQYPLCVEGERACPPEDVGGTTSYKSFVRTIADSEHRHHVENLDWVGGTFDPDAFDAEQATRRMRRGLPNWRTMQ